MALEASKQDRILHVLNRLAFGPRPGDFEHVSATGPERYVQEQLHPESIAIPSDLTDRVNDLSTLHMNPIALFIEYQRPINLARKDAKADAGGDKNAVKDATKDLRIKQRVVMREAVEARMMRAIEGPRQLQEVMTAFWFNHFNVFAGKGLDLIWTGAFEETAIRPHTFGKFRTLLGATAHHPAMMFYLDNWQNTAPDSPGSKGKFEGINENYARELMELHTLGVNGGYTQADVIALAHILTGWGLPKPGGGGGEGNRGPGGERMAGERMAGMFPFMRRRQNFGRFGAAAADPSGFYFDQSRHDFSEKTFLGHQIEGGGIEEGEHALDILARSPATAKHLSFKLAQYFVADDPPKALVERMAQRYLATDGETRAVLETMFTSAEFWDPRNYGAKFKTPYEYVISCVRATGVPIRNYRPLYGTMQILGMPLYACQTPNGYANTQDAWLNPDAMMTRLSFATALGSGNLPLENPPFEEDADAGGGGEMRHEPPAVARNGAGKVNINFDPGPHGPKMTPPDPVQLAATLGDYFSPATASAVEASPTNLRAPLILGSPEFMKR
ncbi:DUF1800 domain-containing protein [Candidatus Binatus sp.]|uniref:DUF1800 domain-containing protein n=3 Tax=Candidatus Binatus sp. TaxID=2811406 RepID=UPI003C3E5FF3